jgi:hypothetical protein
MHALGLDMRDLGVIARTRKLLDIDGRVALTVKCRKCRPPGSASIACCATLRPLAARLRAE